MPNNEPGAVRADDGLPIDQIHPWIRDRLPTVGNDLPTVRQFRGGASNLTYQLDYPKNTLVLRRPPVGTKAASAHDMGREFHIQQALAPDFPQVPELLELADSDVAGFPFYVMHKTPGVVVRANTTETELPAAAAAQLCADAVELLAKLHSTQPTDPYLVGLDRGPGYIERQVAGWTSRYERARTPDVPSFAEVSAWLAENQPADSARVVIHNDFRLDNLVLTPDEFSIEALLDWELATIGDPLMDLGAALAYWVQADDDAGMRSARIQPTDLPGMWTRAEVVDRYCEITNQQIENWTFYEVFGLFRLAGIAQQIYYRYFHKQTTNPAFANFGLWVNYCEQRCLTLLQN